MKHWCSWKMIIIFLRRFQSIDDVLWLLTGNDMRMLCFYEITKNQSLVGQSFKCYGVNNMMGKSFNEKFN